MAAPKIKEGKFKRVGEAVLDERKRLSLAKVADHLRSAAIDSDTEFRFGIYVNDLGQFLLTPEVPVPMHGSGSLEIPKR